VGDEAAHPYHPGRERIEHAGTEEVSELSDRVKLEDLHDIVEEAVQSSSTQSSQESSQTGQASESGQRPERDDITGWASGVASRGRLSTAAVLEGLRRLRVAFGATQAIQELPVSEIPLMNPFGESTHLAPR
jgi:hypothetical protein